MPKQLITKEQAQEYARRSHVARERNKQARQAVTLFNGKARLLPATSEPVTDLWIVEQVQTLRTAGEKLNRKLRDSISGATADEIADLTRALALLFETERILCGRPLPGSRKPRDNARPAVVDIQPIGDSVQPQITRPGETPQRVESKPLEN